MVVFLNIWFTQGWRVFAEETGETAIDDWHARCQMFIAANQQ